MLDGINEFAEYESQQRWIIRRCVFVAVLLTSSYVVCWIPSVYLVNTKTSPAIARWRPIVVATYWPLKVLRETGDRRNYMLWNLFASPLIRVAEWSCVQVDQTVTNWANCGCPISTWWIPVGLGSLLAAYSLSPMPVFWWIKFLGIEKIALMSRLYELYCFPIEWLSDHSSTVRSFYEEYAELFALTD
jgi:hypothetical protein